MAISRRGTGFKLRVAGADGCEARGGPRVCLTARPCRILGQGKLPSSQLAWFWFHDLTTRLAPATGYHRTGGQQQDTGSALDAQIWVRLSDPPLWPV